jgi:hypothetical protein
MNLINILLAFFLGYSISLAIPFNTRGNHSSGPLCVGNQDVEFNYVEGLPVARPLPGEGQQGKEVTAGEVRQGSNSLNDSVFLAARTGNVALMRRLLSSGADINARDERGWTPLDYARKNNRKEVREILQSSGAVTFPKHIPTMKDGPHVRLIDQESAEVYYLTHDSNSGISQVLRDTIILSDTPVTINGVNITAADLGIGGSNREPVTAFETGGKIFVVGDMHGEYSRTADMLRNNGITDEEGNWTWGNGHLVFMGDIFDRGSEVMEALWMIYRLEKQAGKSGGMVHMVLGNHEPMIFNDDLRYVTGDYYSLCDNLDLSYRDLFDRNSLLGFWLRQKPAGIMVNNYLFVHAGYSPEFISRQVGLDSINRLVWRYMNDKENPGDAELRQLILGGTGVLWYRGLADEDPDWEIIDRESLAECLDFYDCDAIIIGHTEVDSIKYFFDGRVVDVNIPKRKQEIPEQGLLIRGKNFRVIYQDGTVRKLIKMKKFSREDWK